MDAENFTYPAKAIPWDPKDATDPKLQAIRDSRKYHFLLLVQYRRIVYIDRMYLALTHQSLPLSKLSSMLSFCPLLLLGRWLFVC